jgi:hypothetical protein
MFLRRTETVSSPGVTSTGTYSTNAIQRSNCYEFEVGSRCDLSRTGNRVGTLLGRCIQGPDRRTRRTAALSPSTTGNFRFTQRGKRLCCAPSREDARLAPGPSHPTAERASAESRRCSSFRWWRFCSVAAKQTRTAMRPGLVEGLRIIDRRNSESYPLINI